eukprot:6212077-Ditylum_brightwellii.AAC.1
MMITSSSVNGTIDNQRKTNGSGAEAGNHSGYVTEIWEAKHSVSPSTIWDALTRKLSSVRQLMDDEDAILSYNNHNGIAQIQTTIPSPYSHGEELISSSPSQIGYNNHQNNKGNKMVFGIFGMELLPPSNAVGQLKAMAVADILSGDVNSVIKAIEC